MGDLERALLLIAGIELLAITILSSQGLAQALTTSLSIVCLGLAVLGTSRGARVGGVERAFSILLGLEIVGLGFVVGHSTLYLLAAGLGLISLVSICSIAMAREGTPRWVSFWTAILIYFLFLAVVEEPLERTAVVGLLGAFSAAGLVALTLSREGEEIP